MDIKLAYQIDGIALAGMIRKTSKIPIVFLTALATREQSGKLRNQPPRLYQETVQ